MMLNRLYNKFKNAKLHTKLILFYLIVVIFPVALIGYFLVERNTQITIDYMGSINKISFMQMKNNISNELKKYIQISESIVSEKPLLDYLEREYPRDMEIGDKYFAFNTIDMAYISKFGFLELNGEKISMYTDNETIMHGGNYINFLDKAAKEKHWYSEILEGKGMTVIGNPCLNERGQRVVPIGKLLNYHSGKFTNILKLDIPERELYKLIEQEGANKAIYILNRYNCIITSTDKNLNGKNINDIPQIDADILQRSTAGDGTEIKEGNTLIYYDVLGYQDTINECKIIQVISTNDILGQINENIKHGIIVCLISLACAFIFVFIFSDKLTKRLKLLVNNMSNIHDGNFDVYVSCDEKDEIGELSRSFKNMLDRIKSLITEVYLADLHIKELEIKKKEAELHALYSQIKPHFIFNTMESIRMNLLKNGEVTVSEIVKSFSVILRNSFDWSKDNVTLKQEFDLVEAYLKIQKFRFKNKLEYDIRIESKLYECLIPKFTLQPIVENAIHHGIELKEGKGAVIVDCASCGDDIKITVKDDGIGIEDETYRRIRNLLDGNIEDREKDKSTACPGIGIKNVHQRLRLNFGKKYGIKIHSEKNSGTEVEILFPTVF